MAKTVELNEHNVSQAIDNSKKPILVNFYTSEEDTHHSFEEEIEQVASSQRNVLVAKLDAFKHPDVAEYYMAREFPTLIMFESGKVLEYCVGEAYSDQVLERFSKYFK